MNIRQADNNDTDRWDDYVYGHPDATPYHYFAWKTAVENTYGHRAYYLIAEENGRVKGILPLIYFKLPFSSGYFVSLPYCDVGDVLAEDNEIKERLILEAVSLAHKLKAKHIELRGRFRNTALKVLNLPVNIRSHKVRMFLDLPSSSGALWNNFKSKLRSQIKKAEKNGLIFAWGDIDGLDGFYNVFSRNMRDLGSPVHSKRWFHGILRHYREKARMGLVYRGRQLIGAGIILTAGNIVSIPWASTLRDFNSLSPNMLLYWNFLKFASDNGYAGFDFGRSTPGEGTYKFKAQWGARPFPLYWTYIRINTRELKFDRTGPGKREQIERIWRNMPLKIANYIGPAIRKHISL